LPLKDRPLRELRRRHTLLLVDHLLRTEGRTTMGAVGILRALSAMAKDAGGGLPQRYPWGNDLPLRGGWLYRAVLQSGGRSKPLGDQRKAVLLRSFA
jgi:hypothetical protein